MIALKKGSAEFLGSPLSGTGTLLDCKTRLVLV